MAAILTTLSCYYPLHIYCSIGSTPDKAELITFPDLWPHFYPFTIPSPLSPIHWLLLGRRYRCTTIFSPFHSQFDQLNLSKKEEEELIEFHCEIVQPHNFCSIIPSRGRRHFPSVAHLSFSHRVFIVLNSVRWAYSSYSSFPSSLDRTYNNLHRFSHPHSVDNCVQFVAAPALFHRKTILSMFDGSIPH